MIQYDRLAPYYDWLTKLAFGNSYRRCQEWVARRIEPQGNILIAGGGTGPFLSAIANPTYATLFFVEPSEKMQEKAKSRNYVTGIDVKWINNTLLDVGNLPPMDQVVTAFFLDQFSGATLLEHVEYCQNKLTPNGSWIVVDFTKPRNKYSLYGLFVWLMIWFFRQSTGLELTSLPDVFRNFDSPAYRVGEESYFFFGKIRAVKYLRN